MYRVFIWSSETGSVKKKKDYQKFSLAQARAVEASLESGVKEVSVCEVSPKGELQDRLGVAAHGEWADGKVAPVVRRERPELAKIKASRRKKT